MSLQLSLKKRRGPAKSWLLAYGVNITAPVDVESQTETTFVSGDADAQDKMMRTPPHKVLREDHGCHSGVIVTWTRLAGVTQDLALLH